MTNPSEPTDPDVVAAIQGVGDRIDDCRTEIGLERAARVTQAEATAAQTAATAAQTAATLQQVELLREKHRLAGRALRRTNYFAVALAVLLAVVLALLVQQRNYVRQREDDRVAAAVASCQSANVTRRAFIAFIDDTNTLGYNALFDAFATLVPPSASPEVAARQALALDQLRSTFAQKRQASKPPILGDRDCSAKAVTQPTIPPPATTTTIGG